MEQIKLLPLPYEAAESGVSAIVWDDSTMTGVRLDGSLMEVKTEAMRSHFGKRFVDFAAALIELSGSK